MRASAPTGGGAPFFPTAPSAHEPRPPRNRCKRLDALVILDALAATALCALVVLVARWLRAAQGRGGAADLGLWLPICLLASISLARFALSLARRLTTRPGTLCHLAIVCLLLYVANGRPDVGGDATAARFAAASLVRDGDLNLDEFVPLYEDDGALPHFIVRARHHYVSKYSIGAPLLASPVFYLLWLAGAPLDIDGPANLSVVWLGKIAASFAASLSACGVFVFLAKRVRQRAAVALTFAYACGTTLFSTVSQSLWQHGPAMMCLAAAMAALPPRGLAPTRARLALLGSALSLCVLCRPADVLLACAVAASALSLRPRGVGWLVAGVIPAAFLMIVYNFHYFGSPLATAYGALGGGEWGGFSIARLAGLLVSPSRGLFVYSPFFLLVPVGFGAVLRSFRRGEKVYLFLLVGCACHILLYSHWLQWWGGYSFGYRIVSDLAPFLSALLVPFLRGPGRRRTWKVVLGATVVLSVAVNAVGAWKDDCGWDRRRDPDKHWDAVWDWKDPQFLGCLGSRR